MIDRPRRPSGLHRAFVALVFVLGVLALIDAVYTLQASTVPWQLVALAVVTVVSGIFAVKVPAMSATLSISETFLFITVLFFGPAAGVVTLALDGLMVSLIRRRRALRQVAFNLAEPAVSMWVASKAYYLVAGVRPMWEAHATLVQIGLPALVLAAVYFVLNSGLNALAVATDTGASPITIWRKYFAWVSLNYFSGASIAVLLAVNTQASGLLMSVVAIAPLALVSYFTFKSSVGRLEDENRHLGEVNRLYLKVVETLAAAVDAKDQVTHGHIRRVQTYALQLARTLGVADVQELRAIEAAALLHDMGKLAIPEHILNKPGKLTPDEYERMKLHAPLGADMLSSVDFPYPVVPIVRHHHENWDGSGYPDRLSQEHIPIGARVLSVVDCYDALRSHRPYRRALSPEQALAIIEERCGTMYDPAVVEAFKAIQADIEAEAVDQPLPEVLDRFAEAARQMRRPEPAAETVPLELRVFATDMLLRLYEQLSALGTDARVAQICEIVSRYLLRLAPAGLVVFYRRVEATDEVAAVFSSGFGEALVHDVRMPMGHGVSGWVAANGRSVINADSALDLGSRVDEIDPKFRSVLSVPLNLPKGGVGVVTLYSSQPNAFREEQRQAIELISGPVAEAFSRALQAEAAQGALSNALPSALANGHALEAMVERDSAFVGHFGRSMGVLCVRNDGAPDVMAHAAAAVSQATRIADLIFRPSEDSLVVLMPDCDPGAGKLIMERVAAAVPDTVPPPPSIHSPIRLAFACSPFDGESVREVLRTAQRRLEVPAEAPPDGRLVPTVHTEVLAGGGEPAMAPVMTPTASVMLNRPIAGHGFGELPLTTRLAVAGVCTLGLACLLIGLSRVVPEQVPLVFALLALSALTSTLRIDLPLTEGGSTLSLSYVVNLVSVMLIGPWASTPIAVVGAWSQCTLRTKERTPWYQTLFSMGTLALAVAASGLVYRAGLDLQPGNVWARWAAGATAASVYFLFNAGLVGSVLAVSSRETLRRVWKNTFLWSAPSYYVGAALALAIAEVSQRGRHWWALVLTVPVFLVYRSYRAYAARMADEQRQVKELSDVQLAMVEALALAIEAKDNTSQDQLRRMQIYSEGLAHTLGMTEPEIRGVKTAALLHDIGNLAVPEHILSKPGRLTYDEYERLKLHPRVGAEIIRSVPFPYPVAPLVLSHHERWDGRGYPAGLKGHDIPLGARILSVVDCFTSMLTDRPYRPPRTYAEAIATLRENGGAALDPSLVERFIDVLPTLESRLHGAPTVPSASRLGERRVSQDVPTSALADIAVAHREEQMLRDIAHTLSSSLRVSDTLALISSRLVTMMPLDSCALFLVDPASELFLCSHAVGANQEAIRAITASTLDRLGSALPSPQGASLDGSSPAVRQQSVMVCGLETENGTIGALAVYHADRNAYTPEHRRLLCRVAGHAAKVIANAVVFEQTQEQSLTDVLTGLPNRRYLDRQLSQELARVQRHGGQVSVLVLDMDGFKQINDEFGHQAGDRALKEVAQTLRTSLRVYDLCARFAGDEFVVVLGECDTIQAERRRTEVQRAVAALWVEPVPGRRISLGVSIGAATFPDDADTAEGVIAVADRRMYLDKGQRKLLGSDRNAAVAPDYLWR